MNEVETHAEGLRWAVGESDIDYDSDASLSDSDGSEGEVPVVNGDIKESDISSKTLLGGAMELAQSRLVTDQKQVQLGMPGAWAVDSSEPSDHYTTKIGGRPDWPASLHNSVFRGERLKCAICGGFLALVAQVHAPLALMHGRQWNERTMYILGCSAPGCGIDPACWRTIRVQKESTGQPNTAGIDSLSLDTSGNDPKLSSAGGIMELSAKNWWDDNNLWGNETLNGETDAAQEVEGIMSMKELESSLMEAGRLAAESSPKESCISCDNGLGKIVVRGGGSGQGISGISIGMEAQELHLFLPVLPCFYIYFQAESITREMPITSSSAGNNLQTTTFHTVQESEDHGGEVWEGEEYEPDRALHVDKTYLKFKKHLDHNPEQCFRYWFGGEVLWAVEGEEVRMAPGKCAACGGPRVYEMQLMPPLLYFLHQAANKDSVPGSYSPDEWDWLTLIVFSCAQSCSQHASDEVAPLDNKTTDWSIVEEATILQLEATSVRSFKLSEEIEKGLDFTSKLTSHA